MIPAPRTSVIGCAEANPLPVTVIIPAYNRADTVGPRRGERASRSGRRHPPRSWWSMTAPADDTAEVARRAGARVVRHRRQPRLRRGPQHGSVQRDTAVDRLLDSDDEWLPHHLASLWPRVGATRPRGGLGPALQRRTASSATWGRPSQEAGCCGRPPTSRRARSSWPARFSHDATRSSRRADSRVPRPADTAWRTSICGFVCSSTVPVTFGDESRCSTTSTADRCPRGNRLAGRPARGPRVLRRRARGFGPSCSTPGMASWNGTRRDWRSGPAIAGSPCATFGGVRADPNAHPGAPRRASRATSSAPALVADHCRPEHATLAVVDPGAATMPPPAGFAVVVPPGRTKLSRYAALARRPAAAPGVDGRAEASQRASCACAPCGELSLGWRPPSSPSSRVDGRGSSQLGD